MTQVYTNRGRRLTCPSAFDNATSIGYDEEDYTGNAIYETNGTIVGIFGLFEERGLWGGLDQIGIACIS
jgi:hypothetical protein